jgi:hypothetical protein
MLNPAFVLAPTKDKQRQTGDSVMANMPGKTGMSSPVLYLTYCLSQDQKWLLACATDERGEMMESTVININTPNRAQRRRFVARKVGLEKLMGFAIGLISGEKQNKLPHRVAERQMRTTGLSSWVLYSRLCWLPSSCESSIGNPIAFPILLRRARTKLDWEFATRYSVVCPDGLWTWR